MGLANDDFRRFISDAPVAPAKKASKPKVKKKGAKPARPAGGQDDDQQKYRDRAEERRRGLVVEEDSSKFLTVEQTKYLGGSIDRTHLVRGLDRLLLNRVKGAHAGGADDAPAGEPSQARHVALPSRFVTRLGESVASILLKPARGAAAELFKPRRMAFVYFADDGEGRVDDGDSDEERSAPAPRDAGVLAIPETLMRSKADCPAPPETLAAAADSAVVDEVVGVLRALRAEGRRPVKGDKKKGKEMSDAEIAQEKAKHVTRLKVLENPALARQMEDAQVGRGDARAKAAGPHARGNAASAQPRAGGDAGTSRRERPSGAARNDSDSDLFDDVGADYKVVDTAASRGGRASGAAGQAAYFGAPAAPSSDLPAIAQHGSSLGNDEATAPAAHSTGWRGASAEAQGSYYDSHGVWVNAAPGQAGYAPPGGGTVGAAPGAPAAPGAATDAKGRGRGFAAQMGDRATVKRKFTTEQRKAQEGTRDNDVALVDDGDVYGDADVLAGTGGGVDDEEEDVRAMDSKERMLNRADFNTDEDFHAYKANRQVSTKAGFQFGVKVMDGRRKGKDLDRKLNSQMNQMRGMNVQREGKKIDFSRFGNAFEGSGADTGATPSRKKPRVAGL